MTDPIHEFLSLYRVEYSKNPVTVLLLTIVSVVLLADLVLAILTKGDWFYQCLYFDNTEVFMDFFYSLAYSMEDQYGYWKIIYPPLITVFYGVIGRFSLPYTEITGVRDLAYDLRDSQIAMMYFIVILLVSLYFMHLAYQKVLAGKFRTGYVEALFLLTMLSTPVIYSITRGNSIILCTVFCFMFVLGYKSDSRLVRYASYVALGCAAGIKIAPVFLAVLILRERKYREFMACAVISVAIFMVPFVFTDGGLLILLQNIMSHMSESTGNALISTNDMIAALGRYMDGMLVNALQMTVVAVISLLVLTITLLDRKMAYWKILVLVMGCIVLCYNTGVAYVFIYMLVPLVYFVAEESALTRFNLLSVIMFATILVLLPWPVIRSVMILIVMAVLFYEGIRDISTGRKDEGSVTADSSG